VVEEWYAVALYIKDKNAVYMIPPSIGSLHPEKHPELLKRLAELFS